MAADLLDSICASVIGAETIRITLLNECGVPLTGTAGRVAVLESFTEVANSPQFEDGQRFLLLTANGDPCVNTKRPSFLNWYQQTVTVCAIDPAPFAMVTGYDPLGTLTTRGFVVDDRLLNAHFAVEVWQPVTGAGACSDAGVQQYLYNVWYNSFDAKLQDSTMQNDTFTAGWQSITAAAPSQWLARMNSIMTAIGQTTPAAYAPDMTQNMITGSHHGEAFTDSPPPASYCGLTTSTV